MFLTEGKNIYFGAGSEGKSRSLRNKVGNHQSKFPVSVIASKEDGTWHRVARKHFNVTCRFGFCIWECHKVLRNSGLALLNAASLLLERNKVTHVCIFFCETKAPTTP